MEHAFARGPNSSSSRVINNLVSVSNGYSYPPQDGHLLHNAAFAPPSRLARVLRFLHLGNHLLKRFPHVVVQPCASFRKAAAKFFC